MHDHEALKADVLIIGGGIAGLRAALEAARRGKETLLVTKSPPGKANNTFYAGGFFRHATDRVPVEKHVASTMEGGRGVNVGHLVRRFAEEAPAMVGELLSMGMAATLLDTGAHCKGAPLIGGPRVSRVLVKACWEAGVRVVDSVVVTDLLVDEGACHGAVGYHKRTGERFLLHAGSVVLATGGAGAVYACHNNAPGATGDGYGLALRAGLQLMDMEFVQFYPLVFAGKGSARMIVPSPYADFGRILNVQGEDLKEKYHLHEKPIAQVARDRLSQALYREIASGHSSRGAFFFDLRGADDTAIPLSDEAKALYRKKTGYPFRPVRVTPACHYTMGGVQVSDAGRTGVKGLFAAGEVVGGIHGANRIAGNSLSEALVFGALAGRSAADEAWAFFYGKDRAMAQAGALLEPLGRLLSGQGTGAALLASLTRDLGALMWDKAGIVRTGESLSCALREIDEIMDRVSALSGSGPGEGNRLLALRNRGLSARAVCASALHRTESRGAHHRDDFPGERGDWRVHIHVGLVEGRPQVVRTAEAVEETAG